MENKKRKRLVVFVCRGNIHRSAIAEHIFKKILKSKNMDNQIEVISRGIQGSAGTRPTQHKNITQYDDWLFSKPSLEELAIDLTEHEAKPITEGIAKRADIIITFDRLILENNEAGLLKQFPELRRKIRLLTELEGTKEDIPDCKGVKDVKFHRAVTRRINDILTKHSDQLIGWIG